MLTLLTRRVRCWAAGILVATYAFGIVMPTFAFSRDSGASIIQSLAEAHGGLMVPHVHHDHGGRENSEHGAPSGAHHCCGVLALPGLPPPTVISVAGEICPSLVAAVPQDQHAACSPARLDRPPRHLPLI